MSNTTHLKQTAEGFYSVAVIGADGQIKRIRPVMEHNLILNGGMDEIANRSWVNCMEYAVAGVGTTPTYRSSLTQTGTQIGGQFLTFYHTAPAPIWFTPPVTATVGDTIVYYGTNIIKIIGVQSPTQADVDPPMVSSGRPTFEVWLTSQSGLATEHKRAGLGIYNTYYVSGTEWCFTQDAGNTRQMRRTWDFSPEIALTKYTELGVSWSGAAGNNLFSRILLDTPEDVDVGERLRVIYQLNVGIGPAIPTPATPPVTGWSSTSGTGMVQRLLTDWIANTGTTVSGTAALEPHSYGDECKAFLSTVSTEVQAYGYAVSRAATMVAQASTVKETFTSGTWVQDKRARFMYTDMVSGNIRSTGLGVNNGSTRASYDGTNQAYAYVFDTAQEKSNTQRLNLTYRFSWDRVLSTENIVL